MGQISHDLIDITDWLPTLYTAAGGNVQDLGDIDGISLWESLTDGSALPRKEILHNIDAITYNEAITIGDWKYVNGKLI